MNHWFSSFTLLSLGLTLTGCNIPQGFVAQLSLQVQPSNRVGTYALSGDTNLPDGTQLVIQGVRHLENLDEATTPLESDQFSILDRKIVEVREGQWEANLSVWQPSSDTDLAESWQVYGLQADEWFQPETNIIFTATTPPSNDSKALERQWKASQNDPDGQQIGFTTEGRWYLQASQTLSLNPPSIPQTAKTLGQESITVKLNRTQPQAVEADPAITSKAMQKPLTDAPLSPREKLQ